MTSRTPTAQVQDCAPGLYAAFASAVKPRPLTSLSQWADRHRILSSKGSGEPGRWNTSRTPHLREIMDALSVNSPVQKVVEMKAAQGGGTEVGLNWIGYTMEHAPAPMLVVVPTIEVRKRWVRQRLDPMLVETPVLRNIFNARSKRDAGNSEDMKDFPGGMLIVGGANSPASLASMPIQYVIFDEVDDYPDDTGGQGDVIGIAEQRQKTFPRRKTLIISSPKKPRGVSIIEAEYNASDMREYFVPCPHCGEMQVLKFRHDDGNYGLIHQETTGRVFYACRANGCEIEEHHKTDMLERGVWLPRHPERKVRGYHWSGLINPIGLGYTWGEIWSQWVEAQQDTSKLKRFVNTTLGEVWEEQGDSIDGMALITRCEDYPEHAPWTVKTAGVDVQKDRLEATIVGWGAGEESWHLDHIVIDGDTTQPEVWDDLHDELTQAGVHFAAVDSGYNTSMVYAFVENRRWCVAVKGVTGMGRPLIEDERKRKQRLRYRRRKAAAPEPLGVDQGKAIVYARLKITQPGAGYVHFRRDPAFDDEYFNQLSAEKLVTKARNGRPMQEWKQMRPRNEALDCAVYALAALRLSGRRLDTPAPTPVPDIEKIIEQPQPQPQASDDFAAMLAARKAARHGR